MELFYFPTDFTEYFGEDINLRGSGLLPVCAKISAECFAEMSLINGNGGQKNSR